MSIYRFVKYWNLKYITHLVLCIWKLKWKRMLQGTEHLQKGSHSTIIIAITYISQRFHNPYKQYLPIIMLNSFFNCQKIFLRTGKCKYKYLPMLKINLCHVFPTKWSSDHSFLPTIATACYPKELKHMSKYTIHFYFVWLRK